MPVHRRKNTTPPSPDSTQEQTPPALPDQQTFRQYLRELARSAIRIVLEGVMREELDALIGVGWGESSPKRKGYRNGFYSRGLATTAVALRTYRFPGIVRATFIRRCSIATAAMNHRSPMDLRRCSWPA